MASPSVVWFRRDLRLADNPALTLASTNGPVVPVYVIDPRLWDVAGPNRRAFLARSLADLRSATDGSLVVRYGDPSKELCELVSEVGAKEALATADFGPYGRQRDNRGAEQLSTVGCRLRFCASPYAVAPGSIFSGQGTPYKVFTPFYRAWLKHGWDRPLEVPEVDFAGAENLGEIPDLPRSSAELPPVGEAAAWEAVESFFHDSVKSYATNRDKPGVAGTSRLSFYLKWGVVHPRQIMDRLGPSSGEESFGRELCWRDFYADVLFHHPTSARQSFNPKMAALEVDTGLLADQRFEAWATGQTGYPIVDAGMRELLTTGWMHNRVRMIVASFLTKDLHIDWLRGAQHFMKHLVDGDLASNNHGWQWVAGTGTDASPYFRVFNPILQSKKFDTAGEYIRRWIPEIAHLPDRSIHEPWTEKTGAPAGYPAPIVDHGHERAESLARYETLKQTWE